MDYIIYEVLDKIVLALLVGLVSSLAGQYFVSSARKERQSKGETIEDRVRRLTKSLEEATALIDNIETEIKARSELATQLQTDLYQYNKLVELKKPEVEAIAQLLRGELKREGRSSFWRGVLVNFIFFILGATASLIISLAIR